MKGVGLSWSQKGRYQVINILLTEIQYDKILSSVFNLSGMQRNLDFLLERFRNYLNFSEKTLF